MPVAEFFVQEYHKLINYARKYFNESLSVSAEDIVQDIALNIFSKVDFESNIENAAAYIYSAIRNRIIDLYRKRKKMLPIDVDENGFVPEVDYLLSEESYQNKFEMTEYTDLMFEAIEMLPAEQRRVLIANELEGRTFNEISREWEIPIGTLLSRKHRAMANLYKIMQELS